MKKNLKWMMQCVVLLVCAVLTSCGDDEVVPQPSGDGQLKKVFSCHLALDSIAAYDVATARKIEAEITEALSVQAPSMKKSGELLWEIKAEYAITDDVREDELFEEYRKMVNYVDELYETMPYVFTTSYNYGYAVVRDMYGGGELPTSTVECCGQISRPLLGGTTWETDDNRMGFSSMTITSRFHEKVHDVKATVKYEDVRVGDEATASHYVCQKGNELTLYKGDGTVRGVMYINADGTGMTPVKCGDIVFRKK